MRTKNSDGSLMTTEERVVSNMLTALSSVSLARAGIARGLGKSYDGKRDLYGALGYRVGLTYEDYFNKFRRQDIAKRIIEAFPAATWNGVPIITDDQDSDPDNITEFETGVQELIDKLRLFQFFTRVDKLSGIGRYSVLFLGINDNTTPEIAVEPSSNNELMYVQPFSEINAEVNTFNNDTADPRFGMPETYNLKVATLTNQSSTSTGTSPGREVATASRDMVVHWTRVIHVAEGLLENNVFGTPRLECIYNRLDDLDKVAGGSSEMYWRGAFPGLALESDPNANFDTEKLNKEIEEYVHNLRRVLRLKGLKANQLAPNIEDPTGQVKVLLELIAGAEGMPMRILIGSERGELASSQDRSNWEDRIEERRDDFATPVIIRETIDRLVMLRIVSEPIGGVYEVIWPERSRLDPEERAKVAERLTKAIRDYVNFGLEELISRMDYLTFFLGFTNKEAESMLEDMDRIIREEDEDNDLLNAAEDEDVA